MISSRRHITLATYLIVAVALADQLTKHWVRKTVQDGQGFRVTDHFNIVMTLNHGITFGLLQEMAPAAMPFVIIGAIALILAILGRWLWRTTSGYVAFSLGLIMGGAIGNVIDRVRYGAVIDFLDFYYKNHHWWAFNIADAAVVTGVTLLVFDSLFRGR